MRVDWSLNAVSDLKTISKYIEQVANLETSNRITRIIYEAVQSLPMMPNRGRIGRIENTRELIIPRLPYVIVYRVSAERVLVVAIVHGARRWP